MSSTVVGANYPPICPCKKWLGVSGTSSAGSVDWYVSGLELISPSAPIMAVISSSSVMSAFPRIALMALFADLIIDSWIPPKCGAYGGLKCQTIPLFAIDSLIFSWSNCDMSDCNSMSAARKFVFCPSISIPLEPVDLSSAVQCIQKRVSIKPECHF